MIPQSLYGACVTASLFIVLAGEPAWGQGLFDGLFGSGGGNQRNNNSWGSGGNTRQWVPDNDSGDGDGHYENRPGNGGGRPGGGKTSNDNGVDWWRVGIDLIDAAARADRNNRQRTNNDGRSHRRNNDDYYYEDQRPRIYRPATPKKVVVKTNKAPKRVEPTKPVLFNANLHDHRIEPLSTEEAETLQQITQENAEKQVDNIKTNLGDKLMDPKVKEAFDKIKQDVKDGKAIDPADVAALEAAVNADMMFSLPIDDKLADAVAKAGEAAQLNESLIVKLNDPGSGSLFPSGPTDVILVPGLPADDMSLYPDGSVVMGTGGQGQLGITQVDGSELVDFPVGAGEPTPDSDADFSKRITSGVLLINPEATGATIEYLLNDNNYSMAPKFSQPLDGEKKWVIRFDRGEGGGEAKYTLANGTYAFGSSDRGWELYRQTFSVRIDNSAGDEPFNYNFNNTQSQAGAGQVVSHTSDYPIFVRFDRGNGKEAKKKVVTKEAIFQVAVNPQDGYWDLYPGDAQIQVAASSKEGSSLNKGGAKKPSSRASKLRRLLLLSQKNE